jgi:aminopeptidase-like protein
LPLIVAVGIEVDERQYCSPGFNLAVGRLSRTPHGEYPEYHTSADTPDLIRPDALERSLGALLAIVEVLEGEATYRSLAPMGEPRLGKRGLYRQVAGQASAKADEMAMLWVLAYADGAHSLLDIAERAKTPFSSMRRAADTLIAHDLLSPA